MPLSRSRDYLSIGEVLETIQAEFPDVSISKIRFLEAEGLIAPERTQSGYRKFYEDDLKRLKYILGLQRDHFLPLKVIRERLADFESNGGAPAFESTAPAPAAPTATEDKSAVSLTDVSLSREELLTASGLDESELRGIEDFGILQATDGRYDGTHLTIAKAARGLMEFGVEPRHLRMYRQLADREATFIEQIVAPVARKRDPDAQKQAARSAAQLLQLSRTLRDALLSSGLRKLL
ncbi:MAG: MerR family transcriptional regulator [Actinomycetota bacterium]|nr:MerR family transcriptional regulator [Actinomycetota bacterium]